MVKRKMGQFAAAHNRSRSDVFYIVGKNSLADNWCRSVAKRVPNAFGIGYDGLALYVTKGSTGSDYKTALEFLRRLRNNPLLPPCSDET